MLTFSPLSSLDFGRADCGPNRYRLCSGLGNLHAGFSPDVGRPSPRGCERGSLLPSLHGPSSLRGEALQRGADGPKWTGVNQRTSPCGTSASLLLIPVIFVDEFEVSHGSRGGIPQGGCAVTET